MNMIFLGAPGAGKGTHAAFVSEQLSIPTISTGDLLRAAIKENTELGRAADAYMKRGDLVPDDLVIGIVRARLVKEDCQRGFILDGFPRTLAQAQALDALGIRLDAVINIAVSDEEIVKRMSGRRVCNGCGATFHTVYKPSTKGALCELCGGALACRDDDRPETVLARLKVYHEKTAPLEAYYAEKGILRTVKGQEDFKETSRLVFEAIGI